MKFLVVSSALLLSSTSRAQTQKFFQETQALTRATPSGNPGSSSPAASRPLPLAGWTSFRLTVCPETGQSITGGKVRLYLFHPYLLKWGYREALDQVLSSSGTNLCQVFGLKVDVRQGYLHPAAVGVTVSGGTTVTVRVDPDSF